MNDLPYAALTAEQRGFLSGVENVVHWTSGNVIFMFQGKCANTAIKAAILEAEGGIDTSINLHADPRLNYVSKAHALKYRATVPVVGFVRRPWDRIVAFWRDKIAGRTRENFTSMYSLPGTWPDMPFPDFVHAVLAAKPKRGDLAPAYLTMTHNGRAVPWVTYKFEELITEGGWESVRRMTARAWDLPRVLPHVNRPKVPRPVMDRDTENALRMKVFAEYYIDYKLNKWNA